MDEQSMSTDELLSGYQDGTAGLTGPEFDATRTGASAPTSPATAGIDGTDASNSIGLGEADVQPTQTQQEDKSLIDRGIDFINSIGLSAEDAVGIGSKLSGGGNVESLENQEALPEPLQEVGVTLGNAGANLIEGVGETTELVGDLGKSVLGIAEEGDNVFDSSTYNNVEWDLGLADNKTAVGNFAAEALSILMGIGLTGVAGVKVGAGKTAGSRLLTEAARGAVVDLIINPGNSNLSNSLEEISPGLKDSWVTALAHEDDDNPFIRRIKNVVEGGLIGSAVDGIGELYGVIRAAKKAVADGVPVEIAVEEAVALYHGTSKAGAKGIRAQGFKTSNNQVMPGKGVYFAEDPRYASAYAYDDGLNYANVDGSVIGGLDNLPEVTGEVLEGRLPSGTKILDIPSTGLSLAEFGRKKGFKNRTELVRWVKEQGYDGIRYDPDINAKPGKGGGLEYFVFDPKVADQVVAPRSDIDTLARPGAEVRAAEEAANGVKADSRPLYEPNERAAKTTEFEPQNAAKSQIQAEDFDGVFPVGSNPVLTDAAYKKIVGPRDIQLETGRAASALDDIIKDSASKIDVDQLSRDLGQSWESTTSKALVTVRNFISDNAGEGVDATNFSALRSAVQEGDITLPFYATREGVVATKTLLRDTAMQIDEVAQAASDVVRIKGDPTRQSEMLFDRLQGLLRMHKTASVHYGSGLNSFKIGSINVGNSQAALTKQLAELDAALVNMKRLVQSGDPKSMVEFRRLTNGLVMAGGDPSKQVGFWAMARKIGFKDALTGMYNSMLSGPLTQTRNILGSLTTTTLRPVSIAAGYALKGDAQMASAQMLGSFHSFGDSIGEAFEVLGTSFKSGIPVNEGAKFSSYTAEAAKDIQLFKSAVEPNDVNGQAFVKFIEWQHNVINSPFLTLPTRTMTAVDDAFKTLSARMELKRQIFTDSVATGGGFKLDLDKYSQEVTQKFAANGEIIDQKLLGIAKEATFQQDLAGQMAQFKGLVDGNPVAKYFFPFVKTPWNIITYGASYVPGVARFLDESKAVMNGTDEVAKAMYRGREALGFMTVMSGLSLGLTGQITGKPVVSGAGDVDPDTRKLDDIPPYSIRIPGTDTWFSYQQIEGIAPILGAVADLSKVAHKMSYGDYQAAAAQLAYSIAAVTTDKSYFQGLSNAVNTIESVRKGQGGKLVSTFAELGNNLIPYSGARRQAGKALSPYLYEYNSRLEATLAAGTAQALKFGGAPRIDVFSGKPIESNTGINSLYGVLNNFLPFSVQDAGTDPVKRRLSEVGYDVRVEFGETLKGVEMSPTQTQELNRLIAEQGLRSNIKQVLDAKWFTEDYDAWVEAKGRGSAVPKEQTRWFQALANTYSATERAAIAQFRATDTEFNEQVRHNQQQRSASRGGDYRELIEFGSY